MRSITQLIQQINKDDSERRREYDAFKQLDDNIIELQNRIANIEKKNMRYFCRVFRTTNQSINTGVLTAIVFDATEYPQFGNMHDNVITNNRMAVHRNGVYHLYAGAHFANSAAGTIRTLSILLTRNGVAVSIAETSFGPTGGANPVHLAISTGHYLYRGDFLQLAVVHDAGVALDIISDPPHSPYLAAVERLEDLNPSEYGLLDPNANMR